MAKRGMEPRVEWEVGWDPVVGRGAVRRELEGRSVVGQWRRAWRGRELGGCWVGTRSLPLPVLTQHTRTLGLLLWRGRGLNGEWVGTRSLPESV